MTQYLLATLAWTGALIALVLLLRRPVARHFGAQAAYALWALPLLRLVTPPITLPAWLAPADTAPPLADMTVIEPVPMPAMNSLAQASEMAPVSPPPVFASVAPIDWVTPLLLAWLIGAGIFLVRRFTLYFAMRRELLAGAKPVGEAGRVRLVETAATLGPVAFGVFDKVIALPAGFMAQRDRHRRDLAIAHELAHHRGHDLLANVLVQPLFAAHWFNPLGWAGWTALRRDQEAACDARVVAAHSREDRAAYAGIIAGFAATAGAAPRLALAAPMACPVLGDKSIIHRLRSLTMADISPRRRFAGRALLAGAALALPLTASIGYAETGRAQVSQPPIVPEAREAAPLAPPVPPRVTDPFDRVIERDVDIELDSGEIELDSGEGDPEAEEAVQSVRSRVLRIERRVDGEAGEAPNSLRVLRMKDGSLTAEERARLQEDMAELRQELAEGGALAQSLARARTAMPDIVHSCQTGQAEVIVSGKTAAGREALFYCQSAAMESARMAMLGARSAMRGARAAVEGARRAIQADRSLSEAERSEALRSIEEALAGLPSDG